MVDANYFDETYYRRYYEDPLTRVAAPEETRAQADFVCGYLKYMDLPVRRVLDMGCGLGGWKAELKRHFPRASYTGVERSDYLCRRFGWKKGSVDSFESGRTFDLVICQDVIQYLPSGRANDAMRRLAALSRGALLFAVLTREDWEENCDQELTDGTGHLRPSRWYRKRLKKDFINAGGGLFLKRDSGVVLYEMEKLA
jgi:trans-aconitate methyltransferase